MNGTDGLEGAAPRGGASNDSRGDRRLQSAAGLEAVLRPRSVAVVGASPDARSVGHRLMANVLEHGFAGPVHPIHPKAGEVLGRRAYARVQDAPGPIDLALVAVPAAAVMQVVRDCAEASVRGLVVVTAGYRETGAAGAAAEEDLGRFVRRHGMRLVGPNCLGVVNADPAVRLHAIFADSPADGGPVALMTQSGALGIALLDRAHRLGLGIGRFVSMGNKLDVSGNDLLLHWADDPGVRVVAMHLESVGNPRNFVRIARAVARRKPILLVKGGRTPEGARAAGSHTGAMVETDLLVDAMVQQAGAVRVATVEALFDAALALSLQPLPAGNRLAIVTNSGGPAILLADALPSAGLRLARLAPATLDACRARLPAGAAVANPLDMLAGASPATLEACLADVLADPGVDAAVALMTPLAADDRPWAEAIRHVAPAAQAAGKPLLAVLFGRDAASAGMRGLVAGGVPAYSFPENAAQALGALHRAARVRRRLEGGEQGRGKGTATDAEGDRAPPDRAPHAVAGGDHAASAGWLPAAEAAAELARLGFRFPAERRCATPREAAAAAVELGFPVAVKVEADGLVHKTEAGAVRLGLPDAARVEAQAAEAMASVAAAGFRPRALLVQAMAPAGTEMIVGAVRDAKFGPIVSVGLGGIYAEALRDVAVALAPVTPDEAQGMIDSLRSRALLDAQRGQPPGDVAALRDLVVALGDFVARDATLQEVEANPVRVLPLGKGTLALDARLRRSVRP